MKTNKLKNWLAVFAVVCTATAAMPATADQPSATTRPDKHYTGTVVSVDPNEHMLTVKSWLMFKKTFNLGDNCSYDLWPKSATTEAGLRPGEKVRVSYRNVHGVLIASQVQQQLMRHEGTVKTIDPGERVLKLGGSGWDGQLTLADGCKIVLRDEKSGTLADIHPGDHVTVIYEEPAGKPTVRQISQTSEEFTGTLTAIDLGEKTLKAKSMFDSKKFNVADNCAIVINGKINGKLSDLRPDTTMVFSYDTINGVNVVNRIAPEAAEKQAPKDSVATTTLPAGS